ncbi:MAG TPA: nitrate reductase molybdenum cofactor assembly chaperone [Xanthobacteraceae bacterium]|nr:nitrate reductase molybdenum cofactor assembly chaperone [Xanthobacteraceae bacterium]
MIVLRAFSALLSYPTQELRDALPEIGDCVRGSPLVSAGEREPLLRLVDDLAAGDLLDIEARYVDLFDRGRATSLNLFEHLHGDSRDRGQAMVELKRHYEKAGFELASRELPDFLPMVLEYLSCRDIEEARDMLADCAHILRRIGEALFARDSSYAAVFQALLAIAREPLIDTAAVRRIPEPPIEHLDREWAEPPAFGGDPQNATPATVSPSAARDLRHGRT